ncbi:hypothetical protein [Actinomadura atramentaria]|uniref:hypothetical protein n=1 Tax=Actinomadura atramentaria TaxID=1990 RepID=UPI0003649735|nr:hypothetical protein [Actinomadura atramentaria]
MNGLYIGDIVVGVGAGLPWVIDAGQEIRPHLLVAGGAGSGRTALARLALAQDLAAGRHALVLDPSGGSRWSSLLPYVDHRIDLLDIAEGLMALGDTAGALDAPLTLVIDRADELLRTLAATPIGERAADVVAHLLTVDGLRVVATCGSASSGQVPPVDQYGTAVLTRYTRHTWQQVTGGLPHVPSPSGQGRAVLVTRGHLPSMTEPLAVPWLAPGCAQMHAAGLLTLRAALDQSTTHR